MARSRLIHLRARLLRAWREFARRQRRLLEVGLLFVVFAGVFTPGLVLLVNPLNSTGSRLGAAGAVVVVTLTSVIVGWAVMESVCRRFGWFSSEASPPSWVVAPGLNASPAKVAGLTAFLLVFQLLVSGVGG